MTRFSGCYDVAVARTGLGAKSIETAGNSVGPDAFRHRRPA